MSNPVSSYSFLREPRWVIHLWPWKVSAWNHQGYEPLLTLSHPLSLVFFVLSHTPPTLKTTKWTKKAELCVACWEKKTLQIHTIWSNLAHNYHNYVRAEKRHWHVVCYVTQILDLMGRSQGSSPVLVLSTCSRTVWNCLREAKQQVEAAAVSSRILAKQKGEMYNLWRIWKTLAFWLGCLTKALIN